MKHHELVSSFWEKGNSIDHSQNQEFDEKKYSSNLR